MENYVYKIYENLLFDNINIEYYATLSSTNSLLKQKAVLQNEGLVIIADSQSCGRGRFDRKFHSPENCGIYMSILLKPDFGGFDATLITTAAAVAVANACDELTGKKSQIKWVNDILIDGKKVCGILTEGCINPKTKNFEYIILGIGINAFTPANGFDDEIIDIAGSVFEKFELSLKARLTALVLNNFFKFYKTLLQKNFLADYKKRNFVIGKTVNVIKNAVQRKATVISMDDDFRLLVEYQDKTREYLSSGEISIKL